MSDYDRILAEGQQQCVIEADEKRKTGYDEPIVKVLCDIRNELHQMNKQLTALNRRKF